METNAYFVCEMEEITRFTKIISQKILANGKKPEVILGIAKGGLAISQFLAGWLEIDEIYVANVRYYSGINKRNEKPEVLEFPANLTKNFKEILIVDDVLETGGTLKILLERFKEESNFSSLNISIASLVLKSTHLDNLFPENQKNFDNLFGCRFYYGFKSLSWIVFKWEINEFINFIYSKLNEAELKDLLTSLFSSDSKKFIDFLSPNKTG